MKLIRDLVANPIPENIEVLVLLESQLCGQLWHTALFNNGWGTVGCHFDYDAPKIVGWVAISDLLEGVS